MSYDVSEILWLCIELITLSQVGMFEKNLVVGTLALIFKSMLSHDKWVVMDSLEDRHIDNPRVSCFCFIFLIAFVSFNLFDPLGKLLENMFT